MFMDEETLWVLKMLSAKKISAKSANRILQGLDLLRQSAESKAKGTTPDRHEERENSTEIEQRPEPSMSSVPEDAAVSVQKESEILVEDAKKIKSGMDIICTSAKEITGIEELISALGIEI